MITLIFDGVPQAVQSMRVANRGKFIIKYQPKKQIDWKESLRVQARMQLPEDFKMICDAPVIIHQLDFIFPIVSTLSSKLVKRINNGEMVYKISRPDVSDNLNKGILDALTGIVWKDDALIVDCHPRKYYGLEPKTILVFEQITQ
jgi:Holliday junction resolvase RusA-like endonuclease